jgi:hypothetical protein
MKSSKPDWEDQLSVEPTHRELSPIIKQIQRKVAVTTMNTRKKSTLRWMGTLTMACILMITMVFLQREPIFNYLNGSSTKLEGATPTTSVSTTGHLNLFIHSVQPSEGSSSSETNIEIIFTRDMSQTTLNNKTIQISEAKHSSDLTDQFQFNYDSQNRVLSLHPKNNDFNFGSENTVTIKISGTIQDQAGEVMGSEYSWSFKTSK